MHLKEASNIQQIWSYAFKNNANVVLMRHGPKTWPRSGIDTGDLSEGGKAITRDYGEILRTMVDWPHSLLFYRTSKLRTTTTLNLMFPDSNPEMYSFLPDLEPPKVVNADEKKILELHSRTGHWLGYFCNHSYYFFEELGGRYNGENPHTVVTQRTICGIRLLLKHYSECRYPIIYCGHSPSVEIALQRMLNVPLAQIGGFLNPLDSFHIKANGPDINLVARVNPILGYLDEQSQSYYELSL